MLTRENVAFELRRCVNDLRDEYAREANHNVAISLQHAETALMWLNRAVFSEVGISKSPPTGPARAAPTDLALTDPTK